MTGRYAAGRPPRDGVSRMRGNTDPGDIGSRTMPMPKIKDILDTMDYGPSPEASDVT